MLLSFLCFVLCLFQSQHRVNSGCFWQNVTENPRRSGIASTLTSVPCSLLNTSRLDLVWGQRSGVPFPSPPPHPTPRDISNGDSKKKKKSQRSNHPNIWMLLHAEHFPPPAPPHPPPRPLSAASGASSTAEGTEACPRRVLASAVLIDTPPPTASFCSHPLVEEFLVGLKAGSAACQSLISRLFQILYGSYPPLPPPPPQSKVKQKIA